MEHIVCPACLGTAKRMPVLSHITRDDFYQCERCQEVSFAPKDASAPPALVGRGSAVLPLESPQRGAAPGSPRA